MRVISCVDDNFGVLFNHRRQSQDRILREKIMEITAGDTLWMNEYAAKMFGTRPGIAVAEDFLSKAQKGDFCFIEGASIDGYAIEEIILFKWNRIYPADVFFRFPTQTEFRLIEAVDFPGSSHEKITKEVYIP